MESTQFKPISEIITLFFATIALISIFEAVWIINDPRGFDDVIAFIYLFIHLIILLMTSPFMIKVVRRPFSTNYKSYLQIFSLLNSLLMVTMFFSLPILNINLIILYSTLVLLELLPIFLIRKLN